MAPVLVLPPPPLPLLVGLEVRVVLVGLRELVPVLIVLAGLGFSSGFPRPRPCEKRIKGQGEKMDLRPIFIATVSL